ncbi:hypothetical protein BASA81_009780 [Batrachochytrium salamandrivorans]|nr:hypothetical protein BASA81_009780 [Batrachochytrium salamandrivorans]
MDEFSMMLPMMDESGMFLEDLLGSEDMFAAPQAPASAAKPSTASNKFEEYRDEYDDDEEDEDEEQRTKPKPAKKAAAAKSKQPTKKALAAAAATMAQVSAQASPAGSIGDGDDVGGDSDDGDKVKKRRQQIALASRASRARRKRELDDLRDENKRLREERSQFLGKIGELQEKVETLRERGSTDMRLENELLRAQLEEHKRFVSCFKRLCDGAPSTQNARHQIYKDGSDSAHSHVLAIISQSQADDWLEATVPAELEIPYSNFSMFYKFKQEYGTEDQGRRRLNVRVDALFPGLDASLFSEFFWQSLSTTQIQERLYNVKGVEITQLADDMPDKDTKTVYYRERGEGERKDKDWVMICNRRRKELAISTLGLPKRQKNPSGGAASRPEVGKVTAMVVASSTTQHTSIAPLAEFESANRITSLFVQGSVSWNVGSDCRLIVIFSMPDDIGVKAVESFDDVVDDKGVLGTKFANIIKSFQQMLGEDWMS